MTKYKAFGERLEGINYVERTGVYGVTFNDVGNIAVVKIPIGYFLPGGGIEQNETHQQCVEREFLEEIGYTITLEKFICKASYYHFSRHLKYYMHVIGYFYNVKLVSKVNNGIEEDHQLTWMEPERCIKELELEHQSWAVSQAILLHNN
jgi:8-oxo-dGTP diphosphatase